MLSYLLISFYVILCTCIGIVLDKVFKTQNGKIFHENTCFAAP